MAEREREIRPDSKADLEADAATLMEARHILEARFTTGKMDHIAHACRSAATELISRSRHPSRQIHGV